MNRNRDENQFAQGMLFYVKPDADEAAVRLTEGQLGIRAVRELPETDQERDWVPAAYLQMDGDGLALMENGHMLRGDFRKLLPRLRPNNLNGELLVKASKLKGARSGDFLTAVDATAGLGEDAFLLAGAGFHVELYERNPVIAALLADALRRGMEDPALASVIGRMRLHMEDSIAALLKMSPPPDIVVLDPMFPKRQKSGLIKKKFQLLQQLEQPCEEETALLQAAVSCCPRRIVIKRPLKGPYLAGMKPSYSIRGKSIRYDCVVPIQPGT